RAGGPALRAAAGWSDRPAPRHGPHRRDYTVSQQAVAEGAHLYAPPAHSMQSVIAVALGYLLGSIPFAYLLTRSRGVDLREVGSRNVGAANVLRTAGVVPAIAVVLLDAGK